MKEKKEKKIAEDISCNEDITCEVIETEVVEVKPVEDLSKKKYISTENLLARYGVTEGAIVKKGHFQVYKDYVLVLKPLDKGSPYEAWLQGQIKAGLLAK